MTKQKGGAIVDLGNVIVAHWLANITADNFDTVDYNSIPEATGAFTGLNFLNGKFGGNVTVVYNATNVADTKIREWLSYHQFTQRTGINLERVIRTRNGRDKTFQIEQSSHTHYGTTVVIDDRLEVLSHFVGKVPNLFLFRPQKDELEKFKHTGALAHVHIVWTWREIIEVLL